ncbi:Transmembrane protein [Phytophthora megakarya]|uniref:Transmembrane protein n=1 Tax=Phytophthora megakarya TaxID=4795 RepID=A0A225WUS1_9STRA|nr:Transmembrane protein [Phytophthora megakarya]
MHSIRLYQQQLKTQAESHPAIKYVVDEKLVRSSDRFGPRADPRAELLVKRQNMLREVRDRRESLAHKLLRKVGGKLPTLQRGKSARPASIDELSEALSDGEETKSSTPPTGTYVFWQNRKLSPKKRALEVVLKKKHQGRVQLERRQRHGAETHTTAVPLVAATRLKTSGSPAKRALKSLVRKGAPAARGNAATPETAPVDGEDREKHLELVAPVDEPRRSETTGLEPRTDATNSSAEVASEETQPFGAYLLLTKHTPLLPPPKHEAMGAEDTSEPLPAQTPQPSGAQSALEKAILKQQRAKNKR